MYYQKGSRLFTDNEGRAENGMLIRHLVLPGYAEESKKVLRSIAEELSTGVNISLMSQYHPTPAVTGIKNLGRSLYTEEYNEVAQEMENLGFRNGWLQEMGSNINYRPDFSREHPFESDK
jgi:putative pyruvate formate lyase activating enzyme